MLSRKKYVCNICVKLHVIDVTSPRSTYTERNCIVFLNAICFKYGTPNPWNGGWLPTKLLSALLASEAAVKFPSKSPKSSSSSISSVPSSLSEPPPREGFYKAVANLWYSEIFIKLADWIYARVESCNVYLYEDVCVCATLCVILCANTYTSHHRQVKNS